MEKREPRLPSSGGHSEARFRHLMMTAPSSYDRLAQEVHRHSGCMRVPHAIWAVVSRAGNRGYASIRDAAHAHDPGVGCRRRGGVPRPARRLDVPRPDVRPRGERSVPRARWSAVPSSFAPGSAMSRTSTGTCRCWCAPAVSVSSLGTSWRRWCRTPGCRGPRRGGARTGSRHTQCGNS